ncbi:hypothetical protein AYI71_05525 [Limosilactobacillus oris]|nr:hypothetical protein AYI71_05525 [Limosilactobacillus oris]
MLYKQIILEWGQDTESGVWGLGYSPDNGKNFYVLNTTHGRKYRAEDGNRLYPYISDQVQDKIDTVVAPAKSAADSAQSAADAAIASAQVTSDAVSAIASATAEAKQGANDAMSRAKSAWDVAIGAKEAVTNFDPLLKSAQSDASNAIAQIADTASALSDAKAAFTSDVAVAKNLASTAQTTADNAIKSASSVADDLTTVANQAKANANGITKVTSDVGSLQTIVADNSGNISTIQETAKQIQQAVSDNAGNITVAKQTADSAATVASDARSNATVAIQTASQASITAKNASGQAASAVITANGAMTTASNAKSDATVAVQTASGAGLTAINANSDATVAKQTASEAKVQASNAESDFAQLSIRANKIEANVANNSGAIASVQQTATGLTTTVAKLNARDGINLLQGTSATENEGPSYFSGIVVTAGDSYTFSGFMSSTSISGVIAPYIQFYDGSGTKLKEFAKNSNVPVASGTSFVVTGVAPANAVTAHVFLAKSDGSITLNYRSLKFEHGSQATPWTPAPTDASVVYNSLKVTVDQTSNIINDPKTGLNATYQTAQGNASTISNVKGDVTQLQTTANGLTSRVGSLESKTATQQTAIEQNKNAIALKADQTNVDTLKGNVTDLQAKITTQANEIENKVTRSDVTGMLTGYATQNYTQSLVTQKANDWNLNLTSLKTDVNAIKTTGGGVNLLQGTRDFEQWGTSISKVAVTNGQETFQAATGTQNSSSSYFDLIVFGNVPLEKDTDYTASFWVKTSENVNICSFLFNSGSNGNYADGATTNQSTTDYTRVVVHFHNGNNTATPNFIPVRINKAGVTVWLYGCMLEKGTVAHDWSPAPSDMATVTSVTNLSATVDGIQAQVYNSDGTSKITQLSNLIATKVSQGDYNSQINQLNNDINLRVKSADLISQINLQAGTALIQSNKLVLDAGTTVFTGEAFIPSAAISSISADKIMLGSSSLWNSDGTLNLVNQSNGLKALIQVKQGLVQNTTQSIISFSSDYNNRAFSVTPVGATITPTLFFERYDQTAGHWLGFTRNEVRRDGLMFHTWDDEGERFFVGCHARFDRNISVDGNIYQGTWNGTTGKPLAGVLSIQSGNTIWSGSDFLAIGDHLSNSFTNVMARSFSQQSTLSSKTNIETVDPKDALDLVNRTDIRSYQYKTDVEQGKTKRYTSLIIDDVNDVSKYYAPDEFTNEERTGRDDGSAVGYLFLAVQELTRRIKNLEEKLNG